MAYFRQIPSTSANEYSYLLADMNKRQALLIDPVDDQLMMYLALLSEIRVKLNRILITHSHRAHRAAAERLHELTGAPICAGAESGLNLLQCALADESLIDFGDEVMRVFLTPGHTAGCVSYLWRDRVFTGHALLIDDALPAGEENQDPGALYDSLSLRLLALPDETLVYPASDSRGRQVSSIGEQRQRNPSLAGLTRDEFIANQANTLNGLRH